MYRYIRTKRIKLNGKRCEGGVILREGDTVTLYMPAGLSAEGGEGAALPSPSLKPKFEVVYEDANILLAYKPPGVLVHSGQAGDANTLIDHIRAYLFAKGEYDPRRENSFAPALANRIDRNTSGIVICAKNAEALRIMCEKLRTGEVRRFYLCTARGRLVKREARLTAWLAKDSASNTVRVADRPFPGAKTIVTDYRVLSYDPAADLSTLEVELITGRTHQIRAHLAHIGHPLYGDGKYGVNKAARTEGRRHQALCSYKVRFEFDGDGCGREWTAEKITDER
jgi:23S rRNA pseudouridine955/2504/2580 synthase